MSPIDRLKELDRLAFAYRADEKNAEVAKKGFVVCYQLHVGGWCHALDKPSSWMPGCIAIGVGGLAAGDVYVACGGNDYDGAQSWDKLRLDRIS